MAIYEFKGKVPQIGEGTWVDESATIIGGVRIGDNCWIGPNATACALATHGQMAGTASALNGSLGFLLATLAGSLVGLLHDGTGQPLALVMACCGGGAWLTHRLLIRPLAQAGSQP